MGAAITTNDLGAAARELASIAEELGLHSAARSILADSARRLGESMLRVLVLGEIKHGKSSLINALLGQALLPTGVTPTTGAVVRVRRGDASGYFLIDDEGARELDRERFGPLARGKEAAAGALEARHVGELLPANLELLDTPGANDINRLRGLVSRGELPGADVLVLVLDATQALTRTELGFVRDALVAVGGVGAGSGAHLLVALNRIDLVAESERTLLTEHLARELGALLEDRFEVFQTDAKRALREPESDSYGVLEVGRLRARLVALAGRSGEILPARARASLRRGAQLLSHSAAIQARALRLEEQALADELAAVRAALAAQTIDTEALRGRISAERGRIQEASRERLEGFRGELQAEVLAILERSDLRAIVDVLPSAVRDATMHFTIAEVERLRGELEALTREALNTHGDQARRRLAQATILLGFRGPVVHLDPPSTLIEGSSLAVSVVGSAIMYFGNTVAGLLVAIAGPLMTMILREKAVHDLRVAAHRELPRALSASFADLEATLQRTTEAHVTALEEHLVLANNQLGEQLVALLDRAASALAPAAGEAAELGERRSAAQRRLEALEGRLTALSRRLDAGEEAQR
ncbi:MAG: dynamin family protein [Nannocystis sp.]|nr:dynamin family protein [Nannocystis sp.]